MREKIIVVRMNESTKELVEEASRIMNLPPSTFARMVVVNASKELLLKQGENYQND
jgi:antitoxin component of RelBE/YafQ-DinJ toxin-antitoxin module